MKCGHCGEVLRLSCRQDELGRPISYCAACVAEAMDRSGALGDAASEPPRRVLGYRARWSQLRHVDDAYIKSFATRGEAWAWVDDFRRRHDVEIAKGVVSSPSIIRVVAKRRGE